MNTIIQSPLATDPNKQQAWTLPDLLFMEAGVKEALLNTILSLIGNNYSSSTVYILQGCVRTGTADGGTGSTTVSAGSVFYNGEIFTVQGVTVSLAANYVVGTLTTTYGTAEVLKDGTSTNVQQIKQVVLSAGASGSGTANFSSFVKLKNNISISDATQVNTPTAGSYILFASSTPTNFQFTTPNDGITRNWRITFKTTHTNTPGGNTLTGAYLRLYNVTDSNILDFAETSHNNAASTGNAQTVFGTAFLDSGIVSLPPNKNIQVQINGISSHDGYNFTYNTLVALEIK